jgi:DNA-binding ferritin-like protein
MEKEYLAILLEDIRKDMRLLAESYQTLNKKIDDNKDETNQRINDAHGFMQVMYKELDKKIGQTAERLDKKIGQTAEKLDKKIDKTAEKLDKKIDKVAERLDKKIDKVAAELDKKMDTVHNELKGDIQRVETKVDAMADIYADHEERITNIERALHN